MAAERRAPLVVLGMDVGDPRAIAHWAQGGYLPTLASIMERGCWGRTGGVDLSCEHGIWVSLNSGISRSEHGYYAHQQLEPGTYDLRPKTYRDARAVPFWSHLRGSGQSVAILDVPDYDPLPGLDGIQLADWATHFPRFAPAAQPAGLLTEVRRQFGARTVINENLRSSPAQDMRIYRRLRAQIERKGALLRHLLSGTRFDLVAIGFSEMHTASHQFWKWRTEACRDGAAGQQNPLAHAIRDVYQAVDRQIGLLLAQLPPDANVVVLSSTGIQDCYPTNGLSEEFCRALGYQQQPCASSIPRTPLALARRALPESWRIAASRRLPFGVQQRLVADRFISSADWARTTVFSVPSNTVSFLRVNLRGREPQGVVEPGAPYQALLQRVEADLRQLVDPSSGEAAIVEVQRVGELFGGRVPEILPDLFVLWRPSALFRPRVIHPRAELAQPQPGFFRGNDHTYTGFFAAMGPSVRARGDQGEVSPLDFAPTFLTLLGQPIPARVRGTPLAALRAVSPAP